MVADVVEFRPGFGRWVAGGVVVLCLVGAVTGLVDDASTTLPYLPLLALVAVGAWAAYWRPAVIVTPAGVEIRNVLRTVEIPWPAVQEIGTQYALTLRTVYGQYSAWAAPAPSAVRTGRTQAGADKNLPSSTYGPGGGVRPGDLAGTDSGDAAAIVRQRWEEARDAGLLDDPRFERERPRVRWHTGTIAALAILLVASVLALAL
ncbi:PH domain-containing protein [Cellulomonas fimi]|uniref:PH domain-containing protein n=1 Tax=Cellulomonas fimi TaxID=1708 RepID=UPI00234D03B7|nr:PH domain-containing protein [Cellulomonas fimi]MDC7119979.1 PH domain-containing protein [Cellulomonas fimi]